MRQWINLLEEVFPETPYGYWIDHKGKCLVVSADGEHETVVNQHFGKTDDFYHTAGKAGWLRVSMPEDSGETDLNADTFGSATSPRAIKTLSKLAQSRDFYRFFHCDDVVGVEEFYSNVPQFMRSVAEATSKLNEGIETAELDHANVRVTRNPSAIQMENLLDGYHDLRGFIDLDDDLYVWDAFQATHDQIADALGLSIQEYIRIDPKGIWDATEVTMGNPNFLRAFGGNPPRIIHESANATYQKWWVCPSGKKIENVKDEHWNDLPVDYNDLEWVRVGYSDLTHTLYVEGMTKEIIAAATRLIIRAETGRPNVIEWETRDGQFGTETGIEAVRFANGEQHA